MWHWQALLFVRFIFKTGDLSNVYVIQEIVSFCSENHRRQFERIYRFSICSFTIDNQRQQRIPKMNYSLFMKHVLTPFSCLAFPPDLCYTDTRQCNVNNMERSFL